MMGYRYLFLPGAVFGVNLLPASGPPTRAVLASSFGCSHVSPRRRWRSSARSQRQVAGSYLGAGL